MDRAIKWIMTLNVWLVFLHYFINTNVMAIPHVASKIGSDNPANRENFISIDCGANNDYMDEETGIRYQTDGDFVETGTNQVVSSASAEDLNYYLYFGKLLQTLRIFPVGTRNCYTLKHKQGKNRSYLIRAFFAYRNYDGKNQNSTFDLYLGVNYWDTIVLYDGSDDYQFSELIHTPSTDAIDVCLVKTGPTIPFISSLELRPLNNSIYQISTSQFWYGRYDVGAPHEPKHSRYKDDIYDRMWLYYRAEYWHPFNTSVDIDSIRTQDAYALPLQVWRTAAQSSNVSDDLAFDYDNEYSDRDKSSKYCLYFHFAEIEQLPLGQKRIISISLNGKNILSEPLALEYLKPVTVISPENAIQNYVHFSISATPESDAPPMLNAFEIYKLETELSSPTDTRDVDAIMDIKRTYKISKLNWQGDPCVPKQFAWEGLICNSDIIPRITSLNLSSSRLNGDIAPAISNLSLIEYLDLSNNNLTGDVPDFLSKLSFLRILKLQGNQLSGAIPIELIQKSKSGSLLFDYGGNPALCSPNSCNKISKNKAVIPLIASLIGAFMLAATITFWMYKRRRLVPKAMNKLSYFSKFNERLQSKKQEFTYAEVLRITNNFERVVGKGGFGIVYHGYLGNAQVAVKVLSPSAHAYMQFQGEVELLTMVHHKCLIALIGYCDEGTNLALIYEYMANRDLAKHLSDKSECNIGWKQRFQIAIDTAEGLEYLHNGCKPPIVHRDVKSRNILLNEKFHGKLADFGLSKMFPNEDDTHVYTVIAGTPGYLDLEYYVSNRLTEKSDVYSFGVVLLEIVTGQSAIVKTEEKIHIVKWVESMMPLGNIDNIVDPRLQGEYDIGSARKALDIAMACVASSSTNRPTMSLVVKELKQCLPMEKAVSSNLHQSQSHTSISFDRISGESSLVR